MKNVIHVFGASGSGGMNMRSKIMHDEWQKKLSCELLHLDGADTVNCNFAKVKKVLER